MKENEILRKFKEKISMAPPPNLSSEDQYHDFAERLSARTSSTMERLDRLQLSSLAKAHTKIFG